MIIASEDDYETMASIEDQYPFAYLIVAISGGWAVFLTQAEYRTWLNQV